MIFSGKDERITALTQGVGPEPESQSKSGTFQHERTEVSTTPLHLKAERVECSITFDLRGFNSGSLPGTAILEKAL
jgi:hypothetical protein